MAIVISNYCYGPPGSLIVDWFSALCSYQPPVLIMQPGPLPPLTVLAGVGAADGGHRGAPRHDQLVGAALVVGGLGLGEDHVVHVKPGDDDVVRSGRGG